MGFLAWLENAVAHIQTTQREHERVGRTIREKTLKLEKQEEMLEEGFTHPLRKIPLEGKIAGVDSGFASQSFYSLDLMMLRTSGVCFSYENGKMVKGTYVPENFGLPQPIVNTNTYEREEFHKFVSLTRLQSELECAIQLIEQTKPHTCFLDGSIIPHPLDRPPNESELKKNYDATVQTFIRLYQTAAKYECTLIGAIEDSRSTRLSEWLHHHVLNQHGKNGLHDAPLLDKVLNAGERTTAFHYCKSNEKHPVLNDFPYEWRRKIHACYLKPSAFDYPLRIEFLGEGEDIPKITQHAAELAYAQSSLHKEYAFPAVLIEADLRAGLNPEEIELVSDKILSKLGGNTLRLRRRDRRPF